MDGYDVLLSHDSPDLPSVRTLAGELEARPDGSGSPATPTGIVLHRIINSSDMPLELFRLMRSGD